MRKLILILLILLVLTPKAFAQDVETDALTQELGQEAAELLPEYEPSGTIDFWQSLQNMFFGAFKKASGSMKRALGLCAVLLALLTLCSVSQMSEKATNAIVLAGSLGITAAMLGEFGAMVQLARQTIEEMSNYAACYLPIMASSTVLSGGISSSSVLYSGTVLFSQLLMRLISVLLIPGVYFFIAIATAESALQSPMLKEIKEFIGWLISKSLRIVMYIFIGYMTITGVIGGTTDATTVKATKAAVSGMIPVVGGIVSDASESLIASASMLKSSVGIFGMLAVLAICIVPFLRVGIQYLMLKVTSAVSATVGLDAHVKLVKSFSQAMGYLLGMCGAYVLLLLISSVCFLKVMV